MSIHTMPYRVHPAFMAGIYFAHREGWMKRAREQTIPTIRAQNVRWARQSNHSMVRSLVEARRVLTQAARS